MAASGLVYEHMYGERAFVTRFVPDPDLVGEPVPDQEVAECAVEWQASLFGGGDPGFDPTFAGLRRLELDATSWIDHLPRWLDGSDHVFAELVARLPWRQRTVPMYDRMVHEPRLVWWW